MPTYTDQPAYYEVIRFARTVRSPGPGLRGGAAQDEPLIPVAGRVRT